MQVRTIKNEVGTPNSYKVYKFSTAEEMYNLKADYEKHFRNSVLIQDSGVLLSTSMRYIESLANDLSYKDMRLEPHDFFMITKENVSLKLDDDAKKKRKLNAPALKLTVRDDWTHEESQWLWLGTKEEVAEQLKKSVINVSKQRALYLGANPGFIPPADTITIRKNAKAEKPDTSIWIKEHEDLLWLHPGVRVRELTKHNLLEISNKRYEYCINNPDFEIPLTSSYLKPADLKNKVERLHKPKIEKEMPNLVFTPEDMLILWSDNATNVGNLMKPKRTYSEIHIARHEYCIANPDFEIPLIARFSPSKHILNKVEVHVRKNAKKEEDTKVLPKVDTVVADATDVPDKLMKSTKKSSKQKEMSMSDIAKFFNQLTVKPKKMTVQGIELEF
jgi:hypothetical protein